MRQQQDVARQSGLRQDIEQAIAAKIHLSLRILPILAEAQLVVVEPYWADQLPAWPSVDAAAVYASEARLPSSPMFIDFEATDGMPTAWEAETWPLPFHLRGALCWQRDDMLCIVPFGSVGGRHLWGGTDYQAWARWIHLQGHSAAWPDPGPGDFIGRANGEVISWIDSEAESICAHQGAIACNLTDRVLSTLMLLESIGSSSLDLHVSRQVRRRAERKGERIGLSLGPAPTTPIRGHQTASEGDEDVEIDPSRDQEPAELCPIENAHKRLNQAHRLWHEAMAAYADPDTFVTRLNSLIQVLRSVSFLLQKEMRHDAGFVPWYASWQDRMRSDPRMQWLVSARNRIEKEGDLETSSVAQVRVMTGSAQSPVMQIEVDPADTPEEVARKTRVAGLPAHVQRVGLLAIERRWTIEELAGDEILDVLAHCHGVLSSLVADGHTRRGRAFEACVLIGVDACEKLQGPRHPSGRLMCMVAGKEARTAWRDLHSGTLVDLEVNRGPGLPRGPEEEAEIRRRYDLFEDLDMPPPESGLFEQARFHHELGKRMLAADRRHVSIAWLFAGRDLRAQFTLYPEDQQSKRLMIERLATEADRRGADGIIFSTEAWIAPELPSDDARSRLRPEQREDRGEAFVTYAIGRGAVGRIWTTPFTRGKKGLEFAATGFSESEPQVFAPIRQMWSAWD